MASRGLKEVPPPGTRVQLTGYFLKSTGQQAGGEGSRKWKVVACSCPMCSRGDYVAVDQPTSEEELRTTYADISKADRAKHGILWRHINKGNLQIVGKVPHSRDTADASELVAGKKSAAQLDAEIAGALARGPSHLGKPSKADVILHPAEDGTHAVLAEASTDAVQRRLRRAGISWLLGFDPKNASDRTEIERRISKHVGAELTVAWGRPR